MYPYKLTKDLRTVYIPETEKDQKDVLEWLENLKR